jgi:hypothetical protein
MILEAVSRIVQILGIVTNDFFSNLFAEVSEGKKVKRGQQHNNKQKAEQKSAKKRGALVFELEDSTHHNLYSFLTNI